MTDSPRSSTETLIASTRIIATWHQRAALAAKTDGDATDHMIRASALTEAAERLMELSAAASREPAR